VCGGVEGGKAHVDEQLVGVDAEHDVYLMISMLQTSSRHSTVFPGAGEGVGPGYAHAGDEMKSESWND
jgi:hypothetical protein